jgi:two-component system, OmpR family, sensor kinase
MSLQRRLVAVMALLLVAGLVVADLVTYAAVRSFLYGQTDTTLAQNEALAFDYFTFAASHNQPLTKGSVSRRISTEVYVVVLNREGKIALTRPSGSQLHPDPAPVLTRSIPVQQVPDIYRAVHVGRYAGSFRPDPDAVVLAAKGDPDGRYRAVAVTVPQGTLVTALSLNQTNDTLASLRNVELVASLSVLLAIVVVALAVVRRGLRPLRQMADTADAIASGDLTRRVPEEDAKSEVGRLGSALNQMLSQIEQAFSEKSDSEERLRQFVADASHELRTPLTSIRGYAELLARGGFPDEASRRKALKRIEEEATRMGGLVEDLLLLAELDQGRPLRAEPVDLQRICADAVGDTSAVARDHRIQLVPGGPVVVVGDSERLAQVAHNLVRNAVAHTPPGTDVHVATGTDGPMGYIVVADNGPGIQRDELPRVFDRFYQADPSRSVAGTGLGLAIVRAIAEALGGSAEILSTPGPGASLLVRIPLTGAGPDAGRGSGVEPDAPTVAPDLPLRSPQLH